MILCRTKTTSKVWEKQVVFPCYYILYYFYRLKHFQIIIFFFLISKYPRSSGSGLLTLYECGNGVDGPRTLLVLLLLHLLLLLLLLR